MTDTTDTSTTDDTTTDAVEVVVTPVYTAVTDLQYADSANTMINATVTFTTLGAVPYTLSAADPEAYGVEIYTAVLAGTYGTITAYAAPTYTTAQLEITARAWRDTEITNSQWLVERQRDQTDAGTTTTLTTAEYSALLTYRQELRDWPTVTDFPADSTKPVAPTWLAAAEVADADTADTTSTTATA